MRIQNNKSPNFLQSLLGTMGLGGNRPILEQVISLIFKFPEHDAKGRGLQAHARSLFPHIDFDHLRAADLIRMPLQMLWLLVIKPPHEKEDQKTIAEKQAGHLPSRTSKANKNIHQPDLKSKPFEFLKNIPYLTSAKVFLNNALSRYTPTPRRMHHDLNDMASHPIWDHPLIRYGSYVFAGILAFMCITTPFNTITQTIFVAILLGIAFLIRKIPGEVATLLLIVLSVTASSRYMWWRINYTLNGDDYFDLTWSLVLLFAELYTWYVLLTGYLQTAWVLKRQPKSLPVDQVLWPTVDVYIPTYNEPVKVVRPTLYAALDIDWPKDKLNIYILDDGKREVFRLLAEEVGVGYITRPDNLYAKAGNLNHALTKTDGEFIAIFDCDHIPTRSFLQVTMGGFLSEPKLALVQTPHHFFSPDPFERNLGVFRNIPNEGELFYGLIQSGNDLWNAAFFCGSCAVLRRSPLEEIGGVATETVTEDAHTSLKLHRRGYTSSYINIPQAAGLATESLSAHISQRIRWARGMAQIFRLDNPFLGKGLTWAQRICYSNAMLHFLNGVPRLIFMIAPMVFLFFHTYVIYAPAISVFLYALPHIIHAIIANSRTQSKVRHTFWSDIYESVLAWYIAIPTTLALINPYKGRFNVTAKGGLIKQNYYDFSISLPYIILVLLNFLGFGFGIWRIENGPPAEILTVVLNLFWCSYNIIALGSAIAVADESKQVRLTHRVRMRLPAILHLPDGKLIQCRTEDFSEGGAAIVTALNTDLKENDRVDVTLWRGDEEFAFSARIITAAHKLISLRWELENHEQQAALVRCTFSRADAWLTWSSGRSTDHPLVGLREVMLIGVKGYARLARHLFPNTKLVTNKMSRLGARIAWWLPHNPSPMTTR
jgi:cellulose synthase (UDP-forming)